MVSGCGGSFLFAHSFYNHNRSWCVSVPLFFSSQSTTASLGLASRLKEREIHLFQDGLKTATSTNGSFS
jgi:hypothetical protein